MGVGTALTSRHRPTAALGQMLHFSTTTAWYKGPRLGKEIKSYNGIEISETQCN